MKKFVELATELHKYFPSDFVSITPSVTVHRDGRVSESYFVNIGELGYCKSFENIKDLAKECYNLMLTRYSMTVPSEIMTVDKLLSKGGL